MLQGLLGKIMAGLLSVSALVSTPGLGNSPRFEPLQSRAGLNYLWVRAKLVNAFEHDFQDVFNCGKPVNLWYKLTVRQAKKTVLNRQYRHTVTYDPMNAAWELYTTESNSREIYTDYQALLAHIAVLELTLPREPGWTSVDIKAEAWLQSVELSQPHRNIDLMVLWKLKRPSTRTIFYLPPDS